MYSPFSEEFDKTRYRPWPCVQRVLDCLPKGAKVFEAGCGNGRNLLYGQSRGLQVHGNDICPELVNICKQKGLTCVYVADILDPIDSEYDCILCIAVIHHFMTAEKREYALENLYNALKPGGSMVITVWSFESEGARKPKAFEPGGNLVPWHKKDGSVYTRYYYIYTRDMFYKYIKDFDKKHGCKSIYIYWEEQNWIAVLRK